MSSWISPRRTARLSNSASDKLRPSASSEDTATGSPTKSRLWTVLALGELVTEGPNYGRCPRIRSCRAVCGPSSPFGKLTLDLGQELSVTENIERGRGQCLRA